MGDILFNALIVVIGLTQVFLAWFSPTALKAYPGSPATQRTCGFVVGTAIAALGIVLLVS
jgi:hypothetical protein